MMGRGQWQELPPWPGPRRTPKNKHMPPLIALMLINSLQFGTGGRCLLTFEEQDQWLRATWTGLVNNHAAMQGARAYLTQAVPYPCACLLNDNLALRGPWFNSVEWLEHA